MALGYFDNPEHAPDKKDIAEALSELAAMWDDIVGFVTDSFPQVTIKWMYSKGGGWTNRMISKKRTVVYLTPCERYFIVGLVYGQRATDAALASGLPDEIKDIIHSARVYAEGRGIRLEIRDSVNVEHIKDMISIKMAH